jgi:hypothetical protein
VKSSLAFELLRVGVPLTLLLDLWPVDGPDSSAILRHERSGQSLVSAGIA